MRGLAVLLTLALVWGVCKPKLHTAKHFQAVYSWSRIDYVFPDEDTRNTSLHDGSFIPGSAVPWGMDVDPETGRMFLALIKYKPGIPASVVTVSPTLNAKGEHMVEPYPDWSWHTRGCDGITSVEKITVDECGRLWVMDTGMVYTEDFPVPPVKACPPQIFIFDLKTDQLIKKHVLPASFAKDHSLITTIVIDVISSEHECRDTFAYVGDTGAFNLFVYDHAHDDSWLVNSNLFYPYPEHGLLSAMGTDYNFMFGIYGMTLSPKTSQRGRTLFFNSWSSAKESYVNTTVLQRKENFHLYNHVPRLFGTFPHSRSGGQTGSEVMDENGVMFFNSIMEMSVLCWNSENDYAPEHFAQVDTDDREFNFFAEMRVVKKDGVSELYIMTNSFHQALVGAHDPDQVLFRVAKAPVHTLIQGTVCVGNGSN